MDPFNGLSHEQIERLALLSEELGEAQQAIGKILRHGYECHNPFDVTKTTNRAALEKEMGDVLLAMDLLTRSRELDCFAIDQRREDKRLKVQPYLHHQPHSLLNP